MNWYTTIDASFRAALMSYGKSYSEIEKGCDLLIATLEKLKPKLPKRVLELAEGNGSSEEAADNWAWMTVLEAIDEHIDHFKFCKGFANGTITKAEWEDFDFDGDLLGMFNSYLDGFYDICDTYVKKDTKFCFVKL